MHLNADQVHFCITRYPLPMIKSVKPATIDGCHNHIARLTSNWVWRPFNVLAAQDRL